MHKRMISMIMIIFLLFLSACGNNPADKSELERSISGTYIGQDKNYYVFNIDLGIVTIYKTNFDDYSLNSYYKYNDADIIEEKRIKFDFNNMKITFNNREYYYNDITSSFLDNKGKEYFSFNSPSFTIPKDYVDLRNTKEKEISKCIKPFEGLIDINSSPAGKKYQIIWLREAIEKTQIEDFVVSFFDEGKMEYHSAFYITFEGKWKKDPNGIIETTVEENEYNLGNAEKILSNGKFIIYNNVLIPCKDDKEKYPKILTGDPNTGLDGVVKYEGEIDGRAYKSEGVSLSSDGTFIDLEHQQSNYYYNWNGHYFPLNDHTIVLKPNVAEALKIYFFDKNSEIHRAFLQVN